MEWEWQAYGVNGECKRLITPAGASDKTDADLTNSFHACRRSINFVADK